MNMPRSRLEKGRSLICASRFLVPFAPAKFVERERASVVAGGEPDEQAGRDQHVIGGAARFQAGGQPVIQGQRLDQRAELVTGLAREQPPGELERVEYLGGLPAAQLALEDGDVYVRVVGDEHRVCQLPAHLVLNADEGRGAGDVLTGYAVNAGGEVPDRPRWLDQPAHRLTDDAVRDRQDSQFYQVGVCPGLWPLLRKISARQQDTLFVRLRLQCREPADETCEHQQDPRCKR